ncbi:hypothetical protein GALMADRAFT_213555 [Galerina marginata CBS 339.88]|uniref:F-box domain-containing protein n=1 Tax=Galerina marginata (strain CBS 339.88) TaxID=685588 RepID=A0A067SZC8_GALM3|nr:hypothetical protein GALMADRAFT_213555 [Galerina marginata CBS 339.88]
MDKRYLRSRGAGFLSLPNELIIEIIRRLRPWGLLSIMLCCRRLQDVATPLLYRTISVHEGNQLSILNAISQSKECYGQYVRTISYTTTSSFCDRLILRFFYVVCGHTKELRNLEISMAKGVSHLTVDMLGELFSLPLPQTSQILHHVSSSIGASPSSCLPHLESVGACGEVDFLHVFKFHNLTSLALIKLLTKKEFEHFLDIFALENLPNQCIRTIVVGLGYLLSSDIGGSIGRIGTTFPRIQNLTVRMTKAHALKISAILASSPSIFLFLRQFTVNDWSRTQPVFCTQRKEALDCQMHHLIAAKLQKRDLLGVKFGTTCWYKYGDGNEWEVQQLPTPSFDELYAEGKQGYAFNWDREWSVIYDIRNVRTGMANIVV